MRKIAIVLLLGTVFLMPIEEVVSIGGAVSIVRLVGVLAILAALVSTRMRLPNPPGIVLVCLPFVLWAGASMAWSWNLVDTAVLTGTYVALIAWVWLLVGFFPSEREWDLVQTTYLLGCYVGLVVMLITFGIRSQLDEEVASRVSAAGMNENELALALGLGVVVAYHIMAISPGIGPFRRALAGIYLLTAPIGILLTASRTLAVGLVLAVPAMIFASRGANARARTALIALILVSILVAPFVVPDDLIQRSLGQNLETKRDTSIENRQNMWEIGLRNWAEVPAYGIGSSAYKTMTKSLVAHNSYISVLVELGIVGAVLFVVIFYALVRLILATRPPHRATSIACLLFLMLSMLTLTIEATKRTWMVFAIVAAMARIAPVERRSPEEAPALEAQNA